MKHHYLVCTVSLLGSLLMATSAYSQTNDAASSGPAANGSPAWVLQDMQGMIQTRARPTADAGLPGCAGDIANSAAVTTDR